MSFESGWAALHGERIGPVPRTEYSAEFHWPLIEAVTGADPLQHADEAARRSASQAFIRAWDYAFIWATTIAAESLGPWHTRMGHAQYMAGGEDWDARVGSPFSTPEDVLAFRPLAQLPPFDPAETRSRFEDHYRANVAANPDTVNMAGVYITCVSGLIDMFGWDLLLAALAEDAERMGELTLEYGQWIQPAFEALAASDVPVVMVHDDLVWSSGPFVHPDWYRRFVIPTYQEHIAPLREAGKRILFTADGNYDAFVDDIVACGVHALVMEPLTNMEAIAERHGRSVSVVGNVDTRVLLSGTRDQIEADVRRCLRVAEACPGMILAVGNHIPPNTPVESALWYDECYRRYRLG